MESAEEENDDSPIPPPPLDAEDEGPPQPETIRSKIAKAARTEKGALPSKETRALPTINDEIQQLELDRLKEEVKALRADLSRGDQIHTVRIWGLGILFVMVVIWLGIILNFVYLTGTPADWESAKAGIQTPQLLTLPSSVTIALIGSTTVTVLGLFTVAARWLYTEAPKKRTKPRKNTA